MFGLNRAYEVRADQASREIDGMPEFRFTVEHASCTDNQPSPAGSTSSRTKVPGHSIGRRVLGTAERTSASGARKTVRITSRDLDLSREALWSTSDFCRRPSLPVPLMTGTRASCTARLHSIGVDYILV